MCGIGGVYIKSDRPVNFQGLDRMSKSLIHRGPDGHGEWVDGCLGMMHRRLSIMDVSKSAAQPMKSACNRYILSYNGEVYNFKALRNKYLSEKTFRSTGDTEVILELFALRGDTIFAELRGMFACAIWDRHNEVLTLARDSFGIKPLYYSDTDDSLVFASEIKAIKAYTHGNNSLDYDALAEYMWFGNPLGNRTFYTEICELEPGTIMVIGVNGKSHKNFTPQSTKSYKNFSALIQDSVRVHSSADVNVGLLLSGGMDSSAIALNVEKDLVTSYTASFSSGAVDGDEQDLAKAIALDIGIENRTLQIDSDNLIGLIEKFVRVHDEPFGDAANIAVYQLCKEASRNTKVILQGDGGDEFFGGYSRYKIIGLYRYRRIFGVLGRFYRFLKLNTLLHRSYRIVHALSQKEIADCFFFLLTRESVDVSPYSIFNSRIRGILEKVDVRSQYVKVVSGINNSSNDLTSMLMLTDQQIILKDTFLTKVDIASMQASVEVRVPLIDNEVRNYANALSGGSHLKKGSKSEIRTYLQKKLPKFFLKHKKRGFGVPFESWLRDELKEDFIAKIDSHLIKKNFNVEFIKQLYEDFLRGDSRHGFLLWKTYILVTWLRNNEEMI